MERLPMTSRKRGSDSNHQTPAQDRQDAFPPALPVPSSYRQLLLHRSKQHSHQNAAGPTFSHRSGRPHSRMRTNSRVEVVGGGDMAYRKHPGTSLKNKGRSSGSIAKQRALKGWEFETIFLPFAGHDGFYVQCKSVLICHWSLDMTSWYLFPFVIEGLCLRSDIWYREKCIHVEQS